MTTQSELTAIRKDLNEERRRPSYVVKQADGKYWRCEQKAVKSKPLATLLTEKEANAVIAAGTEGRAEYYASR